MSGVDFDSWFVSEGVMALVAVTLSALGIYIGVIIATRLGGLRSFSKMSGFDFAMTVAIGSLIASTIVTPEPPLMQGLVAVAAVYALQIGVAMLRQRSRAVSRLVDNEPLLLMRDGEMIPENLRRARVTEADVYAKLREANVLRPQDIRAVVMETTGDVSVLHGEGSLDERLLDGVRR